MKSIIILLGTGVTIGGLFFFFKKDATIPAPQTLPVSLNTSATSTPLTLPGTATTTSTKNIQKIVEAQVMPFVDTTGKDTTKAPSIVVGVVTKDFSGTFGYGTKTIGTNDQPDGNTFYSIGSVSKVFTGIILADEISKGNLKLNQPANSLLHEPLKSLFSDTTTLGELISHTSGLKNMPDNISAPRTSGLPGNVWWSPAQNYARADLAVCLRNKKCLPVQNKVGTYLYSNLGIGILGIALEDSLSFVSYDELLKARVLIPLNMNDTGTNTSDFINKTTSRNVSGYGMYQGKLSATSYADMGDLSPSGEIITTGNDMLKFMKALIGIETTPLTPAVQLAIKPLATIDQQTSIGFALDIDHTDPHSLIYEKNGSTPGFSAYIMWKQNPQIGIVVLTNKADARFVKTISSSLINEFEKII